MRPTPLILRTRPTCAGEVRCRREDLDLAEERRQRRQRRGGQSEADLDCRPGGDWLEGVQIFWVVDDGVSVGNADDGGDGGSVSR